MRKKKHPSDIRREQDEEGISLLERALKNQIGVARTRQWRNAQPTLLIVRAHSGRTRTRRVRKVMTQARRSLGL
ncbi:MAG: hypothetical protein DID89_2727547012 [Candidatus Nitrotoga sp. CP45]|nr:MAG: hypothetical protein DID89_2727547012 [Candidatus Nitrotoga sp. CP45]